MSIGAAKRADSMHTDMVPVGVLHAAQHTRAELLHEHRLLVRADVLDRLGIARLASPSAGTSAQSTYLLHDAAAVHLQRQPKHLSLHRADEARLLRRRAVLEHLLNHLCIPAPDKRQPVSRRRARKART